MKFKMSKEGFTLLVSNMALGGAYFSSCEEKYDIPDRNREGEEMLDWTRHLTTEFTEKEHVELDDDEFFSMLMLIRSGLEACIEYDDKEIYDMLVEYVGVDVPFKNKCGLSKSNVRYCFMLLEYLESIAPKGTKKQWEIEKKHIAKDRIDRLLDRMEER